MGPAAISTHASTVEEESLAVQFCTLDGISIVLEPPATFDDTIISIKRRIAAVLGLHHKQIMLVHNATDLEDDETLLDSGISAHATSLVSVLKQPCQIKPSDYDFYIDREAKGFLLVDNIQCDFGYPAEREAGNGRWKIS